MYSIDEYSECDIIQVDSLIKTGSLAKINFSSDDIKTVYIVYVKKYSYKGVTNCAFMDNYEDALDGVTVYFDKYHDGKKYIMDDCSGENCNCKEKFIKLMTCRNRFAVFTDEECATILIRKIELN